LDYLNTGGDAPTIARWSGRWRVNANLSAAAADDDDALFNLSRENGLSHPASVM